MNSRRVVEFWVGLFVAAGCVALFVLAMKVSNLSSISMGESYHINAHFANIGGLSVRAPIKVSGVLVGRVSEIGYDEEKREALVTFSIEKRFDKFPTDTSASILTAGLLGEQYIGLVPGVLDTNLKDGDRIIFTDSAVTLESIIGKIFTQKVEE